MLAPAIAATLALWTGPGDRACLGRCPMEWALGQLAPGTRAAVVEAMAREPRPLVIRDGDVLGLMTYYHGGPLAQHGAVAVLDAPEAATGWCVRVGCFVQVHACENWAFVLHTNMAAGGLSSAGPAHLPGGAAVAMPPALYGRERGFSRGSTLPELAGPSGPAPFQEVPPVPLPAPLWLLLTGMAALWWVKRHA